MAKLTIKRGATSVLQKVVITNSSGNGMTGLTASTSGLACYYIQDGNVSTASVPLSAGTLGTWVSGGFVEVNSGQMPGLYEFGIPNAALSGSTARGVVIWFRGASGMQDCPLEIELDATDNQDAVRGGMTALPNANAGANGGLPLLGESAQLLDTADIAAIWGALTSGLTTSGSIGKLLATGIPNAAPGGSGGLPTIGESAALLDTADIAAIWGALTSSLSTSGSIGKLLAMALPAVAAGQSGGIPLLGESAQLLDTADILAIWAVLTSALTTTGSIGSLLANAIPNHAPGTNGGISVVGSGGVTVSGYATGQDPASALAAAGVTAARMQLLEASNGNWTRNGNVITMQTIDGLHTFRVTFDDVTNPSTANVVQLN